MKAFGSIDRSTVLVLLIIGLLIYITFSSSIIEYAPGYYPREQVIEPLMMIGDNKQRLRELYREQGNFKGAKLEINKKKYNETTFTDKIWIEFLGGKNESTLVIHALMKNTEPTHKKIRGKVITSETLDGAMSWSCGFKTKYIHANHIDKQHLPNACQ